MDENCLGGMEERVGLEVERKGGWGRMERRHIKRKIQGRRWSSLRDNGGNLREEVEVMRLGREGEK